MTTFSITPVTPTIGAEIGNIDLRDTLSDETMADLEQAFLKWKVLFFRDQDIEIEDQKRLGLWFGELDNIPPPRKKAKILKHYASRKTRKYALTTTYGTPMCVLDWSRRSVRFFEE